MASTSATKNIVAHATKNPHTFAQKSPRYTCRRARHFQELSESKGFKIKCRNINCSLECNGNWAFKHGTCLARHLQDNLPPNVVVLKGHLTLKKNATPEQHQAAKDAFLLSIRRWAKRHGHRVELHAVIHVTDPQNAHWDYHLWTTANYWHIRTFFNAAWKRAGGDHSVCVEPDSIDATARYQAKPVEPDPKSKEVVLPASQKDMGLDTQWSTRGFWCGRSVDAIWRELIAEWKAGPVILTSEDYQAVRGCPECDLAVPKLCPVHSSLAQNKTDITDTPFDPPAPYQDRRYLPGEDRHQDRQHFARKLPRSIDDAVGLADYAARWGVDPAYMVSVLGEVPNAVRTDGERDRAGRSSYGGWYRRE